MKHRPVLYAVLSAVAFAVAATFYARSWSYAEKTTIADLSEQTHFHGIAVDTKDPTRLYLATHRGFFIANLDGTARRISESRDDFMGFTAHPTDPSILYASGHPESGGNLGFNMSRDGGRSWNKISNGAGGPVDFHQLAVSKADSRVVYGVHGNLQRSADDGQTWTRVGPAPNGIIALAASSNDADVVYAATQSGLLHSPDGGRTWKAALGSGRVATTVHVTRDGSVYAFIVGLGLVRAAESELAWQLVSNTFGEDSVIHLASTDRQRLYAITFNLQTKRQGVLASRDGGLRWTKLGSE